MKKYNKNTVVYFLLFVDLFLVCLMAVLLIRKSNVNKPSVIQASVLNTDFLSKICKVEISEYDQKNIKQSVTFFKEDNIWLGKTSMFSDDIIWPCDSQIFGNFIEILTHIDNLYKIGVNEKSWKSFDVDEENAVCISFLDNDNNVLSKLFYGAQNPLTQRIAVRSFKNENVYEVSDSIMTYLTVDSSFWADPFIYPQCVTGFNRKDSDSLLRRGKLIDYDLSYDAEPQIIKKDFENGAEGKFVVYCNNDEYVIHPYFEPGIIQKSNADKALQKINYFYTISSWTYEKFIAENK